MDASNYVGEGVCFHKSWSKTSVLTCWYKMGNEAKGSWTHWPNGKVQVTSRQSCKTVKFDACGEYLICGTVYVVEDNTDPSIFFMSWVCTYTNTPHMFAYACICAYWNYMACTRVLWLSLPGTDLKQSIRSY